MTHPGGGLVTHPGRRLGDKVKRAWLSVTSGAWLRGHAKGAGLSGHDQGAGFGGGQVWGRGLADSLVAVSR